jgi:hypothetical protein
VCFPVELLGNEGAAGEAAHQIRIDRRVLEHKAVDINGDGQLGDGELVSDRTRLLLRYLGPEQIADQLLRKSAKTAVARRFALSVDAAPALSLPAMTSQLRP